MSPLQRRNRFPSPKQRHRGSDSLCRFLTALTEQFKSLELAHNCEAPYRHEVINHYGQFRQRCAENKLFRNGPRGTPDTVIYDEDALMIAQYVLGRRRPASSTEKVLDVYFFPTGIVKIYAPSRFGVPVQRFSDWHAGMNAVLRSIESTIQGDAILMIQYALKVQSLRGALPPVPDIKQKPSRRRKRR
jgi:hypothetical protein